MRTSARSLMLGLLLAGLIAAAGCAQAPAPAPPATSPREELRALILGGRAPADLRPRAGEPRLVGDTRIERVRFTPQEGHDAVALIYRPRREGLFPAVIVQHFWGGSKDEIVLVPLLHQLAQRGFLVAAIDGRYRGERQNGVPIEAAIVEALRTGEGRPFLVDTAYDVLRLIDYLETRPDVDPARIGMTGISEGGIITWLCAAVDERIRAAVPIIGVTVFGEALAAEDGPETAARIRLFEPILRAYARDVGEPGPNGRVLRLAWEKLVPGMLDRFDAPRVLPLIAPRPLLILSHGADELFPVEGARKAHGAARERYRSLGAEDRISFRVAADLKHAAYDPGEFQAMLDWMTRWLGAAAE